MILETTVSLRGLVDPKRVLDGSGTNCGASLTPNRWFSALPVVYTPEPVNSNPANADFEGGSSRFSELYDSRSRDLFVGWITCRQGPSPRR